MEGPSSSRKVLSTFTDRHPSLKQLLLAVGAQPRVVATSLSPAPTFHGRAGCTEVFFWGGGWRALFSLWISSQAPGPKRVPDFAPEAERYLPLFPMWPARACPQQFVGQNPCKTQAKTEAYLPAQWQRGRKP